MALVNFSAKRLHECSVQFEDERLERVTLFPFFDGEGRVHSLLLVDFARWEPRRIPHRPGLFGTPLWGKRISVRTALADLPDLGPSDLEDLGGLWHFDPWWLLDRPPFDRHPATPLLKTTNCVNLLEEDHTDLRYERDLARVEWLMLGADQSRTRRWGPDLLPARGPDPPEVVAPARRAVWVLDPIWQRL